jgi:hypothetical protein
MTEETMKTARLGKCVRLAMPILSGVALFPLAAVAQSARGGARPVARPQNDSAQMSQMADHVMSGPMDENMMKHMELTPLRSPTRDDSIRATKIATELRQAIAKYQDTAVARADGYQMFLPNVKEQRVYHFTNYRRAFVAAFHFDATKPTSILYKRGDDGKLHLIGAMYTMPKNAKLDRLDARVPLSIARWHKHVNWCIPKKGDQARWTEQRDGHPVFGPESPIATKTACDSVNGDFHESAFGWMIHANVVEGHDLASIWSDDHHREADRAHAQ